MLIDIFFIVTIVISSIAVLWGITYIINESSLSALLMLLVGGVVLFNMYVWVSLACGVQLVPLTLKLYISLLLTITWISIIVVRLLVKTISYTLDNKFNLGRTLSLKMHKNMYLIKNKISVIRKARIDRRSYDKLKTIDGKLSMTKGDGGELTLDDK